MIPLPLIPDFPTSRPVYWRAAEELEGAPELREFLEREFPAQAGVLQDSVSRRQFLSIMGASLAMAGSAGCARQAPDKIVPHVRAPEQVIPGKPLFFATVMPMPGGATGLLVESHQGRPTKVEGNPDHPASLGAAGIVEQASVLGLYDPDRSQALTYLNRVTGWGDALEALRKHVVDLNQRQGQGLALLTGAINSPSLAGQIKQLQEVLPQARWYMHEPAGSDAARRAAQAAFGQPLDFVYHIGQADQILALDSDFLTAGPNHLRHTREFARRRNPDQPMNRLYAVESTPTATGFRADHRLPLRASQIETFARAVAARLGVIDETPHITDDSVQRFIDAAVGDLRAAGSKALVIAGKHQPPAVHTLAMAINNRLGCLGTTVHAIAPVDVHAPAGMPELCQAIDAGEVSTLLILSVNPVYSAPGDLSFTAKLKKVGLRIHLGLYDDETSAHCHWHIPEAHYLESWSDARGADGTASIIQPLIAPLYEGKTAHEVLSAVINFARAKPADAPNPDPKASAWQEWRGRQVVRDHWRRWHQDRRIEGPFEAFWRKSVHDGVIAGSAAEAKAVALKSGWEQSLGGRGSPDIGAAPRDGFELFIRPDPALFDGRFANNAWLQELPKPLTKLVWDNAAIVSPKTAETLGITPRTGPRGGSHGELITETVTLSLRGRSVTVPLFVMPGHPDQSVTLHMGYGRAKTGRVANGVGTNAFALRSDDRSWHERGLRVERTNQSYLLGCTQFHHWIDSGDTAKRDIVRAASLAEYRQDPRCMPKSSQFAGGHNPPVEGFHHQAEEFYTNTQTGGPHQWGMTVDLSTCTGCSACVIACQSENNIPTVGKELVTRGREMHWLRIDRYFAGDTANPQAVMQPVMCQHCENAPCEVVCPVEATTHSPDGLNEMTYNRCVGTRYCANNCPYKVRRFNFLEYVDYAAESLALQRNPDVSVRVRGVMEKCTYCVQRIRAAEIEAKVRRTSIGAVVTACQAACPAEAIVFGNIADPASRVSRSKKLPRDYGVLTELNTKPRTTYLAAVRNPHPSLSGAGS